jgi:hypothetical protein
VTGGFSRGAQLFEVSLVNVSVKYVKVTYSLSSQASAFHKEEIICEKCSLRLSACM